LSELQSIEAQLKTLFVRGLDGDQAAYREFLSRMSDLLRRYIQRQLLRVGRPDNDAEDIVQEAILAIHAKRHVYERDVPVTAWAHAIARYRMIDMLRATHRSARNLPIDDFEDLAESNEPTIDTTLSVRRALADLPEKLRRPVELMKLDGLSVREAAEMTNTSESSVKTNVHRGLKALARALR
jgi:RNA polymerase sigma-70 factor (ECF subfamily)